MKLTPASSARWMMRMLSSWSLVPQSPNIMVPRHRLLTDTPVRPSGRCSIGCSLSHHSTLGHACRRVGGRSGLDEHLQGLAVGHGAVAVRHLVEADGAVEDPAGLDPALEHIGEQFLDVGRAGAAPPVMVMLRRTRSGPSGPSAYWGRPTRLIAPPSR